MIGGPARCFRLRPFKTQLAKIKFVHEHVDDTNRVVLGNIVVKAFREQRALRPIFTLNKALHRAFTSLCRANEVFDARNNEMFQTTAYYVFTQPRPEAVSRECRSVESAANSGHSPGSKNKPRRSGVFCC